MEGKNKIRILGALILVAIFVGWTYFLHKTPPTEVVAFFGTTNSYFLVFALAFVGGMSILFPFPYYLIVFTLAAGKLNPAYLALLAGTGVMLGDSTSYFVGYTGREILSEDFKAIFNRIYNWFIGRSKAAMFLVMYAYAAFVPFSNDIIVVPLGIMRFPYYKTIIPMWLGNITFNAIVAFSGFYGFHLLGI